MGDIADMYTDYPDEYDQEPEDLTSCKVCKKPNLRWEATPAGWRLFEGTKLHECCDPFKIVKALEKKAKMIFTSDMKNPIPGNHRRKIVL